MTLLFFGWPAKGHAQSSFRWVTNYYTVTGSTFHEIMASMDRARPANLPAPMTGYTEWKISWRIHMVRSPGGCLCDSFTTQTTITNTLPVWKPPTNTTPQLMAAWRQYYSKLAAHEGGHSQIALAALAEVHKEVVQAKEAPDYESLKNNINNVVNGVLDHYRKLDADYDERTAHGTRQPATPIVIVPPKASLAKDVRK